MARPLILFLDLDGVFKTARSIVAKLRYDPIPAKLINDLCSLPDTRVVISATCRLHFHHLTDAQRYWRSLGMPNLTLHEHWYSNRSSDVRTVEIQDWLLQHHVPENEYVFLDDEFPTYNKELLPWTFDIMRVNWLLVGGHNNGLNYMQCRALRDLYDTRSGESTLDETDLEEPVTPIGFNGS